MSGNWLELAIVAFIMLTIGYVVWRGGAANPEGTRSLGSKVGKLSGEVGHLGARMKHFEKDLDELKHDAATTKDIARLEERIAGQHALAERTCKSVERIERFLIEKGLNGK